MTSWWGRRRRRATAMISAARGTRTSRAFTSTSDCGPTSAGARRGRRAVASGGAGRSGRVGVAAGEPGAREGGQAGGGERAEREARVELVRHRHDDAVGVDGEDRRDVEERGDRPRRDQARAEAGELIERERVDVDLEA